MTKLRRAPAFFLWLGLLAGCREEPMNPQPDDIVAQFAPGGVPGPPPWVIIPHPPGPPPRVPVPLPPQAGPPSFLSDIIELGAGAQFSCALRSDGNVYCWGANGSGQLGDGSVVPSPVPVEVSGPTRFARLFVGNLNACGLTATGEAWCWGDNRSGQIGAGSTGGSVRTPQAVAGGHSFAGLSIGLANVCGVATDGFTYCWGSNQNGLLGTGVSGGLSNVPVAVSNSASLGFVAVSVTFFHACALDVSGNAYCWGSLSSLFGNGATGGPVLTPTPAAGGATLSTISAGTFYTCALDPNGAASCWGTANTSGELGIGSTTAPVLSPTPVAGGLSFASLDAFSNNSFIATTCALTTANAAWCWGSNQRGQLGTGGTATCTFNTIVYSCAPSPVAVDGGIAFEQIAVGIQHVCALDVGGSAWCWGSNQMGELGDGSMVDRQSPVRVQGLTAPQMIGSIVVSPPSPVLRLLASTQQFTAQALDENGVPLTTQPTFAWSSSDPAIAAIDASGVATALSNGSTIITATSSSGQSGHALLNVRIIDPVLAFQQAWAGGGVSDGIIMSGGLLADEWAHSGTFTTRREMDVRTITTGNLSLDQIYAGLDTARIALEFEATRLQNVDPTNPRIGQMLALAGYVYLAFAENFCSGVPVFDPDVGLTTGQLFNLASTRFGQAVGAPIAAPYNGLATVGTGRAQLGVGNFGGAAAAVSGVPTTFTYVTANTTAAGEGNAVFLLNTASPRFSVAESEGTNGLPFRSSNDPRVPWVFTGIGFNGVTPHYRLLKYPAVDSDIIIASGVEARLIEAEAALAAADIVGFLGKLNLLRAVGGLAPVVDPGSAAGRADLLFRERAFWMFATGQRLGDLRRLIAFYGRSAATLFPTGAYPIIGGSYGTDANLPVPASARGPAFAGCTNRSS